MVTKLERNYWIDSFKGLFLILITIDHSNLFLKRFTFCPVGFFCAATGFIFLSGYVFGLVYSRYIEVPRHLYKKTFLRLRVLHQYHIVSFLIISIAMAVYIFNINTIDNDITKVYNNIQSVIKFFFLLIQPSFFDILPMYIIFISFSPFLLLGFKRQFHKSILFISFFTWFLIQLTPIRVFYNQLQLNMNINLGFFNVFAWQFLFVMGLYCGYCKYNNKNVVQYSSKRIYIVFAMLIMAFLIRQLGQVFEWVKIVNILENRNYLHFFSLINFLLFAYVVGGVVKNYKLQNINYFAFLGRYSLDVFCFHLIWVYLFKSIEEQSFPKYVQIIISIIVILSLAIPAIIKSEIKGVIKEKRKERIIGSFMLFFCIPRDMLILIKWMYRKIDLRRNFI
nr:OpgC domain-containing protein [uncultured Carboxylicivirga sp.]